MYAGIDEDADGLGLGPALVVPVVTNLVGGLLNPKATQSNVVQRFQMAQAGQNVKGSKIQGAALATTLINQVYDHLFAQGNTSWQPQWQGMLDVATPANRLYMEQKAGVTGGGVGPTGQPVGATVPPSVGVPSVPAQAGVMGALFSPLGLGVAVGLYLLMGNKPRRRRANPHRRRRRRR